MLRFRKRERKGERGDVLLIVLCMLALGGLLVTVNLNYATSNLKSSQYLEENTRGVYAASAGMDHALWSLANGETPLTQLSENISRMEVEIQTETDGVYTLYFGELMEVTTPHYDWVGVSSVKEGEEGSTCNITITVEMGDSASGNINVLELGMMLPAGYSYETGSASLFPSNITADDPDSSGETAGGINWLEWQWSPGHTPQLSPSQRTLTQSFQISGSGSLTGDYAWVRAQDVDIYKIGEITGTRYRITSTARRPEDGKETARVTASVIAADDDISVISWQMTD